MVPEFWKEWVPDRALKRPWPDDLDLTDAPALVQELKDSGRWLEQETITLDPLGPELAIDGPCGTHRIGPELRAVWFRQPVFLRNTPGLPLTSEATARAVPMDGVPPRPLRALGGSVDELANRHLYRRVEAIPIGSRCTMRVRGARNPGDERR